MVSCKTKKYEDYNERDFVEKQGIVISTKRTSNPIDNEWNKDVTYAYNLDKDTINYGVEKNIDLMFKLGQPIVILVHKDDEEISFYARRGVINEQVLTVGFDRLIPRSR